MEGMKMPLTKALLNLMYATGQVAVDFYYITHDAKYHRAAFARGGHDLVVELKRIRNLSKNKRKLYQTLYQLKRSKFVEINEMGDRLMINLTNKGRKQMLLSRINMAPICIKNKVIVVFDIPESKKSVRDQLRLFLKEANFIKLQQSVWVTEKEVYKILLEFINDLNINSWVKIFYIAKYN